MQRRLRTFSHKQRTSRVRNLWQSKVFLLIIGVLVVLFLVALSKEISRRVEVNQEISSLEEEIAALEGRNDELYSLIAYLNTDARYEKEARLRLGLQKPGENVLVVPGLDTQEESDRMEGGNDSVPYAGFSNPERWWVYFFSRSE